MVIRSQLVYCLLAWAILASPGQARQSAEEVVSGLQKQWALPLSGHASVLSVGNEVVITVTLTQPPLKEQLPKFAAELASHILSDNSAQIERLLIIFQETTVPDKTKFVALSSSDWQAIKDKPSPALALTVMEGGRADGMFVASARGAESVAAAPGVAGSPVADTKAVEEFEQQRTLLLARLEVLQKKGMGTQMYGALLANCEEACQQGNVKAAREGLGRLSDSLKEQEEKLSARSTMRLKTGVSQSVAMQPALTHPSGVTSLAAGTPRTAPVAGQKQQGSEDIIGDLLGHKSIADFKGNDSQAAEQLARLVLSNVLGKDCPEDGPFLAERLRIARRIQELEHQKVNVTPYRVYVRDKIEYFIKTKDPRALNLIAENIKYLERQIGLEILTSGKKSK